MIKLSLKLSYYVVLFLCCTLSALQIQFLVLLLTVVAKFILLRLDVTTQARRHGTKAQPEEGMEPGPPPIEMRPMIKM